MGTLRLRQMPSGTVTPAAGWNRALSADEVKRAHAGSIYDSVVLSDAPKAFWPLKAKQTIVYASYDVQVLGDSPKAYWKLNAIDTV